MTILSMRELLQFPPGDNETDTLINGVHFNTTTLNYFNYTLYSNGTLSNGSKCWLTFDIYKPLLLSNGTFINGTSCYVPIKGLKARGSVGIAFAALFAATLFLSVISLRKHGERFLPLEKRWTVVGRRAQWYWMIFLTVCGVVSCFMSIDVDRDYLPQTAIILQSFFYYLMIPVMLAMVWEGVRHWGSWQERQVVDRDSSAFPAESTRERQELFLPLLFYLFAFLSFFLYVPRSWSAIEKQRTFEQQEAIAKQAATDTRFKAGNIIAGFCICIICYSLGHSLFRYKWQAQGQSSLISIVMTIPAKFIIVITLAGISVAFNIASSFIWQISPLKYDGNPGYLYGLGYGPPLVIVTILNIFAYLESNEDRELIRQRIQRGRANDTELGIEAGRRKPAWWRRLRPDFKGDVGNTYEARLRALTTEVGGGRPTQRNIEQRVEMGVIDTSRYRDSVDSQAQSNADPFTDDHRHHPNPQSTGSEPTEAPVEPGPRTGRLHSSTASQFSQSSGETLVSQARNQPRVRSMLDV
ncbi:TPA_exp: Uncharacterized protein A8136_2144 [Trichophyton benhamiae CBS 112371]|nr:TPA_exp: Uncharacterized protein A8136_2144 [Trichophyton benhamiae CBS 112371]